MRRVVAGHDGRVEVWMGCFGRLGESWLGRSGAHSFGRSDVAGRQGRLYRRGLVLRGWDGQTNNRSAYA